MHQASPEKHRKIVAALVGAAAKLPKTLRGALRGPKLDAYLRGYYANVDVEDLAGREPAELANISLPLSMQLIFRADFASHTFCIAASRGMARSWTGWQIASICC